MIISYDNLKCYNEVALFRKGKIYHYLKTNFVSIAAAFLFKVMNEITFVINIPF